jgi:hypothetical protein
LQAEMELRRGRSKIKRSLENKVMNTKKNSIFEHERKRGNDNAMLKNE